MSATVVVWWIFSFLRRTDIGELVADVWAELGTVLPADDAARRFAAIAGPDARARAEAEARRLQDTGDPERAVGWRRIAESLARREAHAGEPTRE